MHSLVGNGDGDITEKGDNGDNGDNGEMATMTTMTTMATMTTMRTMTTMTTMTAPPEGCLEQGCASVAVVPQDELAPPFDVGRMDHDLIFQFKALL